MSDSEAAASSVPVGGGHRFHGGDGDEISDSAAAPIALPPIRVSDLGRRDLESARNRLGDRDDGDDGDDDNNPMLDRRAAAGPKKTPRLTQFLVVVAFLLAGAALILAGHAYRAVDRRLDVPRPLASISCAQVLVSTVDEGLHWACR